MILPKKPTIISTGPEKSRGNLANMRIRAWNPWKLISWQEKSMNETKDVSTAQPVCISIKQKHNPKLSGKISEVMSSNTETISFAQNAAESLSKTTG